MSKSEPPEDGICHSAYYEVAHWPEAHLGTQSDAQVLLHGAIKVEEKSGLLYAGSPKTLTETTFGEESMSKMRVAFFDTKLYDKEVFDLANAKREGVEIYYFEARLTPHTVDLVREFDAVCIFVNDRLNASVVDKLVRSGVKLIALRCAGYNNVDLSEAKKAGVPVVRVPAYSPWAVAEHALALIMTLNRKTHRAYYRTRDSNFNISGLTGFDLHGKVAGVVGTGKIGRSLISILKGAGMRIVAHDPYPLPDEIVEGVWEYVELDQLFRESNIISLHCPLTPETHHMIHRESIEIMKKGVMLINTSRGKLIDTEALIAGLKQRHLGSAGLDVYEEEEEYFFEDWSGRGIEDDVLARLLTFSNVLVTSHQAFLTEEALEQIAEMTLDNITSWFMCGETQNRV